MLLKPRLLICTMLTTTLLMAGISIAGSAFAKSGGGKGGGNAGGGNGGADEIVYSAAGDLVNEPAVYIDSTNLNFDEIIFRPSAGFSLDLSGFDVSGPDAPYTAENPDPCSNFSSATTGTLVLGPGDSAATGSAELRFGFQGLLSDGSNTVQHYLVMHGVTVHLQ